MARYIDADALIDFIDVGHLRHPSELCFSEIDVVNMLNHAPSIEIVRCGECEYMMSDGRCYEFADDYIKPSASDFCSYGRRKSDE